MNEFKSAYKNFNGSDYTIDEEKYSGFSISKKQIIVDGKNELYSEIITWSTMAIATTLQPKIMALDFALLFAPKDKTPYGSYTQYTVILYEKPIEKSYPIKHGPYVIGSKTMVFQNYTVETYIVGPGTAGMVIKSGTYFYDAEKMHYYATHPGARR